MSVEGVRVVRGPNWCLDSEDGGEGHVGTVTQDNEDDTVEVQWDMGGESSTCNTGKDGKCDLRVLDSAPAGLKHGGVRCDGCNSMEFPGTRWRCSSCDDFDLCTQCYFHDKHNTNHAFFRIDAPGLREVSIKKRSASSRLRALGLFAGATVKRGVDWNYGNQDGGSGQTGIIQETVNYGQDGRERDAAKVKWLKTSDTNRYRVGYKGKVDLECVEEAAGMDYYKDHLFPLSTVTVPKMSIRRKPPPVAPKPKMTVGRTAQLQPGDRVFVDLPEEALKEAQRGHGGWSMRMKEYIGKPGVVQRLEANGDYVVNYGEREFQFNALAVKKHSGEAQIKVGDTVRILSDSSKVQALQRRHGGWQTDMSAVLGKVGKVVKIDSDGDVAIAFGNKAWVFNPSCCERAPGCKVFEMAETTSGGASGGGRKPDDDDEGTDETADALSRLIAQMFLIGQRSAMGTQQLISAAANNNSAAVQSILNKQPKLIDEKFKGLTALVISSHEGHITVVRVLLKAGANTDTTDEKGNTALMAALMKKREEVATLLLEAGANIHLCNVQRRTALHCAATNSANNILRTLLKMGADVNKQDAAGDTPLHDAIEFKNNTGVSFLVADSRINLKLCNNKGLPTLHTAAMKDDELAVSRIISKAPELINCCRTDGHTALHYAALNNNSDVTKTLIKAKATVDRITKQKYTPLHLACHQGYMATSKLLIENNANVNAQDEDGDTPLHNCLMGQRKKEQGEELMQILLGVRVTNEREVQERTNIACLLIQGGARTNIRNRKGRTAIECCSNDKMRNTVRTFAEKHGRSNIGSDSSRAAQGAAANLLGLLLGLQPCMGCMENTANTRLQPCGCRVLCKQCCFRTRECPMCDQPILERYDLEGKRIVLVDPCQVQ